MMRPVTVSKRRTQRGFTLVEMMIAMVIGLILSAGVIQIFLSSRQSYRMQEGLSRLQENARFAMGFLTREVRMAGFTGCYRGTPSSIENILNTPNSFDWGASNMLGGNDGSSGGSWTPALDTSLSGSVLPGTDVINIRHMGSDSIDLIDPFNNSAQLFVDTYSGLNLGDVVMVTNCSRGSVFQLTNIATNNGSKAKYDLVHSKSSPYSPGNASSLLGNSYGPGSEVAKMVNEVFYIGTGTSGAPALFERSLQNVGGSATMVDQELVDNVEDMQILYGEDTDNDGSANKYVGAATANMANVVSIRISLLLRTGTDHLAATPQTYTYNGQTVTATDHRIRRVFTSTVKLRNRGVI